MQLRPYQTDSVALLRESMRNHKRVVLCLPTGAGKSVVFSELVRLSALKSKRILVLTHRIELFNATFTHLENNTLVPELIRPGLENPSPFSLVTVAMVETLMRRINKGLDIYPDLIIIDEAHFGNFTKIIDVFPDAFIIGVTATPIGKHFHKYYTKIVSNIDIPELIQQGFLLPCVAYQMVDDFKDVKITSMGEFEEKSLFDHFNKSKLYDGVIEKYKEKLRGTNRIGQKTLVFNVNIEHTENMCRFFNEAGIPSRFVTSKTPKKEREAILLAFKNDEFPVLNNCGILTTGYDEPSIEAIIMNRATLSLPLWLQCQGRGSRPFPGKTYFTVLDFGCNHDRHGRWQEERVWSLEAPKKKKKLHAHPVKTCPECAAVLHPSVAICEYCGYEFPLKENEIVQDGILKLMSAPEPFIGKTLSKLSIKELSLVQDRNLVKASYVWRVVRSHGAGAVREFAKIRGYKKGWIYFHLEKLNDSKYKDIIVPKNPPLPSSTFPSQASTFNSQTV